MASRALSFVCLFASLPNCVFALVAQDKTRRMTSQASCKGFCAKNAKWDWSAKCAWDDCTGCDQCSSPATPAPTPAPAAVACVGNCALGATVTCQDGVGNCGGSVVDGDYPPDKYSFAPIFGPLSSCAETMWVQIDLGQPTTFSKITLRSPNRENLSPPGWCGRKIEVQNPGSAWTTIFDAAGGYTPSKSYTVDVPGTTAQIIKVYQSKSMKNPWTHLLGIEVY